MIEEFRQFAGEHQVSAKTLTDVMRNVITIQRITPAMQFLVADAFEKYVNGDLSCHRMAELAAAQGYPVTDEKEMYFETVIDKVQTTVFVTCCGVTPMPGRRTVALGTWNVSYRDRVEFYPFFVAAMFDLLDPARTRDPSL